MSEIIYEVVKDFDKTTGEAAMEFLIALAIGHLQLNIKEYCELLNKLSDLSQLAEHFLMLISSMETGND